MPRILLSTQRFSCPARRFLSTQHSSNAPKVVFSGIQPTGVPHLGNYLGALRQWADLQSSASPSDKLIFSIVDLHAITQRQAPEALRLHRREMLAAILAVGIDPNRSIVFEQSRVPQHAELMWILSCGASTGYLSRMTQWKSKLGVGEDADAFASGNNTPRLKLGLFSYPVLQAADILVHRATEVPVGEDQAQHLEFTREVAGTFHSSYGTVFPLPKTVLSPARRVMSLRDPLQKMSKSDPQPPSRILLIDTPEEISKKFQKAVTDSEEGVTYDPRARPGVSNLVQIYAHMQRRTDFHNVANELKDCTMKELKDKVAGIVIEGLRPIRDEYERISKEGDRYLEIVAEEGARKARESAEETMVLVRHAMGLA
ncbi:hypothetical protein FN846DRAFT_784359 [Sphaerosporella brunnea]|uniref:Tryptophan--tRNA ligase, mitochondrial n=1 Tax=Sphaerosporella brunnea TaxID=1250544 RepID=A0A5J5EJP7_9PEZI|nr:hypothetical protein FN846DRAFT_784359 [Sphaerosporella brunnea]